MNTGTIAKQNSISRVFSNDVRVKAALFDELLEVFEEKHFAQAMKKTEHEKNIPMIKAKKLLS